MAAARIGELQSGRRPLHGLLKGNPAHFLLFVAYGVSASEIYRVRLAGISVSGFRLALMGAMLVFLYHILRGGEKIRGLKQLAALALPLAGIMISGVIGGAQPGGLTLEMLQNNLLGLALIVMTVQLVRTGEDLKLLVTVFVLATGAHFLIFSALSLHSLLIKGIPLTDLPFRDIIPLPIESAGHLERGFRFGDFARLALPFSTPPHLAAATILVLVLLNYLALPRMAGTKSKVLLFLLLGVVLVGTFSRTGYLMAIVGAVVAFLVAKRLDFRLVFGLATLIALTVILALGSVGPDKAADRLMSTQSNAHHLSTRMQALSIWMRTPATTLFGIGLGDYSLYGEGPHSHSDYTTMLSERGILGVLSWFPLFGAPLWGLSRIRRHSRGAYESRVVDGLIVALIVCLFGGVLYQILQIITVWLVLALAYAAWAVFSGGIPGGVRT